MKKIFIPLALCGVLFASCKKDYTCECDITSVYTNLTAGGSETYVETSTTTYKDVKKSFVEDKAECFSTEYTETYEDWFGDNIQVVTTSDCSISK